MPKLAYPWPLRDVPAEPDATPAAEPTARQCQRSLEDALLRAAREGAWQSGVSRSARAALLAESLQFTAPNEELAEELRDFQRTHVELATIEPAATPVDVRVKLALLVRRALGKGDDPQDIVALAGLLADLTIAGDTPMRRPVLNGATAPD